MIALAALVAFGAPSDAEVAYYNARLALRDGDATTAVKLWWLRNALADRSGEVSAHDGDFRSATWVALGDLGVCPDGLRPDADGAGLWPVALHNWVVRNHRKTPNVHGRPFDAFEVGRQARVVSIDDVLGREEIGTVELLRGRCARPRWALVEAGENPLAKLSDRPLAARLLQFLLHRALETTDGDLVLGRAALEARLFDIHLQLTAYAAREARQRAEKRALRGRELGLTRSSAAAMRSEAPEYEFGPTSEPARILTAAVQWPVSEWMTLSPDRRRFLFDHARRFGGDPAALRALALGVVDELAAKGDGAEVAEWIARASDDPAALEQIWGGERGRRLLALGRESGFRESAAIALRRGVQHLEAGELQDALRTMAYALVAADDSLEAEAIGALSRRWLAYAAGQFALTDDLLVTLQELVPKQDYAYLLEDLLWRAALHADRASFERGLLRQRGATALARRLDLLRPLAAGDVAKFARGVAAGLRESPSETLRFLEQWVERIEQEDADVRAALVPAIVAVREPARKMVEESGSTGRSAGRFMERTQAILDGLGALDPGQTARDRARSLDPTAEVFAGSVRLAPADPMPWPFRATDVTPPSIFAPLTLVPVEWRGSDGEWVFGWRVEG